MHVTGLNPFSLQEYPGGAPSAGTVYGSFSQLVQKVGEVASEVKSGFSSLPGKALDQLALYTPSSARQVTEWVKFSGDIALKVIVGLDEVMDFANFGGTKDPIASIAKSRSRLAQCSQPFLDCCDCIAELIAQSSIEQVEQTYQALQDDPFDADEASPWDPAWILKSLFFEQVANGAEWLMVCNRDLIVHTVKANLLHLFANLSEQAFDPSYPFNDSSTNPLGRLLSLIGNRLAPYEERLTLLSQTSADLQMEQNHQIFQEMATDLLTLFFPHGSEDIQLFHHTLPVKWIKEKIWISIKKELPIWLESLYLDMRPLSHLDPTWEQQFKQRACDLEPKDLLHLPALLLKRVLAGRGNQLDALEAILEEEMRQRNIRDAHHLSQLFVRYIKQLLLTQDPVLLKMGRFLEHYVMERLLYHVSHFGSAENGCSLFHAIIQQWIEGRPFEVFSKALQGNEQDVQHMQEAVVALLAPFGLHQEEHFPLPSLLRRALWPAIARFQQEKLPGIIVQAIPKWEAMKQKAHNRRQLTFSGDLSFVQAIDHLSSALVERAPQQFQMETFLPNDLSEEQKSRIYQTWQAVWQLETVQNALQGWGKDVIEAVILQLCVNLFENGRQNILQAGQVKSFVPWLFQEILGACQHLSIEKATEEEKDAFKKAIALKNAINATREAAVVNTYTEELEQLWPRLRLSFEAFTLHLLHLLDCDQQQKLPVPAPLQAKVWTTLQTGLPRLLFEQTSDGMLPLLEKQDLQQAVFQLPNGELIQQVCHSLAQDSMRYLLQLATIKSKELPALLKTIFPEDVLSYSVQHSFKESVQELLQQEQLINPFKDELAGYLEAIFLKIALRLSQLKRRDLQRLGKLVQKTRSQLLAKEQGAPIGQLADDEVLDIENEGEDFLSQAMTKEEIVLQFTHQLFALLGVQTEKDFLLLPPAMRKVLFNSCKQQIARVFLNLCELEAKIRNHAFSPNLVENQLPTSQVKLAAFNLACLLLNKLTHRREGQMPILTQLYPTLNSWLDEQNQKGYQFTKLLQQLIEQGFFTPYLEGVGEFLDSGQVSEYKQKIAHWIQPLLTDQLLQLLTPLLLKEQAGQEAFDQALLMAILSPLTQYFKSLNQALPEHQIEEKSPIGEVQEGLQSKHFYEKQVDLLFEWIFPNGLKEITKHLSKTGLTLEQATHIREEAKKALVAQLPAAWDAFFSQAVLDEALKGLFEVMLDKLDAPIQLKLSQNELPQKVLQMEIDQAISECFVEMMQFMHFPFSIFNQLNIDLKEIKALKAIRAAVIEKFNGHFLSQSLQHIFTDIANKQTIKTSEKAKAKGEQTDWDELERKLARKLLGCACRYIEALFEQAIVTSAHPILHALQCSLFAVCSFIIHMIGAIMRLFKIEQFMINRLYEVVHLLREKFLYALSQPSLREVYVRDIIEDVEEVLFAQPALHLKQEFR